MDLRIAPSLLSADFGHLAEEIEAVAGAGADWIHVDVMDGHFVPEVGLGVFFLEQLTKAQLLPVDVHLMVTDPATYGRMATSGTLSDCESEVLQILLELHRKHVEYAEKDGERFLDAVQNARLVANAERYYRRMYHGSHESWNLRDTYMYETLDTLRRYYGSADRRAKAIVWAHNSHVGDASATEMSARGETNLGKLARAEWGDEVYIIGFGTDSGTVAAASDWDGPMQIKTVLPGRADSYEKLFHDVGLPGFFLGLKDLKSDVLKWNLAQRRLERAIGVIYRPET